MTHYACTACHWTGTVPSMTDASAETCDANGRVYLERTHRPVCPACFELARHIPDPTRNATA